MFCKNCGNCISNIDGECSNCGKNAGSGNAFCPNCGSAVLPNSMFCAKCGVQLNSILRSQHSKLLAGLLGIFLGGMGIHNFYLGYIGKGIVQIIVTIITCGFGSIWGLIEGIVILCSNNYTDADGNILDD